MPKDTYRIVVLPGDGVGAEVATDAMALLDALETPLGVRFALEEIPCGGNYYLANGRDWPENSEARCRAADAVLLGAVGWPGPDGKPITMTDGKMAGWSPVIGNRVGLDLYANVRPVRCLPGIRHGIVGEFREVWPARTVDLVIVRENTEGLYSGIGERAADGSRATDTRVITERASRRVIRRAFELARARNGRPADGKKQVTCIVKNNVLKGCQLFLDVFRVVGAEFPDIAQDVAIVDAFALFLLTQPDKYDVCVTTNMFGDILTDLAAVLQGGMGMAVGCNVGDDHGMFEPIHGTAPGLAGQDKANPMAMHLATAEALRWLGTRASDPRLVRGADAIADTIASLVAAGTPLTADLVETSVAQPRSVVTRAVIVGAVQRATLTSRS